jgi:hypothetical protein
MLPELADLLDGFELYAERRGVAPTRNDHAVDAALREAADLARSSESDEPAALFYALARRPRAFGEMHGEMLFLLAVEQAHAVGLDLTFEPVALQIHRLRIVRGQMSFQELRDWFEAHLEPIEPRPWPPR